jgi:hypothetical protein
MSLDHNQIDASKLTREEAYKILERVIYAAMAETNGREWDVRLIRIHGKHRNVQTLWVARGAMQHNVESNPN